jgi:hypothetical protein
MFSLKFVHKLHTIEDGGYCIRATSGNISTNQVVSEVEFEIEGHRCYFGHELDELEWGTH